MSKGRTRGWVPGQDGALGLVPAACRGQLLVGFWTLSLQWPLLAWFDFVWEGAPVTFIFARKSNDTKKIAAFLV